MDKKMLSFYILVPMAAAGLLNDYPSDVICGNKKH